MFINGFLVPQKINTVPSTPILDFPRQPQFLKNMGMRSELDWSKESKEASPGFLGMVGDENRLSGRSKGQYFGSEYGFLKN